MDVNKWIESLGLLKVDTSTQIAAVMRKHDREQNFKEAKKRDNDLRYSTKQTHRNLFGAQNRDNKLDAIVMGDGSLSADSADILRATEEHFTSTSTPTVSPAMGVPPWERVNDGRARDHFTLPRVADRVSADRSSPTTF